MSCKQRINFGVSVVFVNCSGQRTVVKPHPFSHTATAIIPFEIQIKIDFTFKKSIEIKSTGTSTGYLMFSHKSSVTPDFILKARTHNCTLLSPDICLFVHYFKILCPALFSKTGPVWLC